MGCWGTGPFDNDAAGDMVAGLAKKVYAVVEAATDIRARSRYYEARPAVQFILLAHGTDILGGPGLGTLLKALARMRSDTGWLSGFREPEKLAQKLEAELNVVAGRMEACRPCREACKEFKKIITSACAVPVPKTTWLGDGAARPRRRRITTLKLARRSRKKV